MWADRERRTVRRAPITEELANAIKSLPPSQLARLALRVGASPATVRCWAERIYHPRGGDPRVLDVADALGVVQAFASNGSQSLAGVLWR